MKNVVSLLSILALAVSGFSVFAQYGGGGGGGGSSSLQRDYCPNGDNTFSYYDGLCDAGVSAGTAPVVEEDDDMPSDTTTATNTGTVDMPSDDTTDTTPVVVVPEVEMEDEETIMDIKDQILNNNAANAGGTTSPTSPAFNLPTTLPNTGASL